MFTNDLEEEIISIFYMLHSLIVKCARSRPDSPSEVQTGSARPRLEILTLMSFVFPHCKLPM